MKNTKRIISIFSVAIYFLNLFTFSVYAEDDLSENIIFKKKPVIKSVHFEESKEKAEFFMVIVGENFRVDLKNTTTKITATGPEGKDLDLTNDIEHVLVDKIVTRVNKDLKSGNIKITQKHAGTKESVTTEPFYLEVPAPEIHFIYGKNGVLPGEEIEIYGKNLAGTFAQTTTNFGKQKNKNIEDNRLVLTIPNDSFDSDVQVTRDGLVSNKVSLSKIIPPILQTTSIIKMSGEEDDQAIIAGRNFPNDSKRLKVKVGDKYAKIIEILDEGNMYSQKRISIKMPKPLLPNYSVNIEVDKVPSNCLEIEESRPIRITSVQYVNKDEEGNDIVDLYLGNLPSNYKSIKVDLGGQSIAENQIHRFHNKLRIITNKKFKSAGEVKVVVNGKYETYPVSYDFTEDIDPFIYFIESRTGFHVGVIVSIYAANIGIDSSKVKISGIPLETAHGLNGIRLYGNRIQILYALPSGKANDIKLDSDPKKLSPVSITIDGRKSNIVDVPLGSDHPKSVYGVPIIQRIEYPEGKNAGKKIIIHGRNFGTQEVHNSLKLGSKELKVTSVNQRCSKIEALLPEDAKSAELVLTRTFPYELTSEPFEMTIAPSGERGLSFEKDEDADKKDDDLLTIENQQKDVDFANFKVKNFVNDLLISKFRFEMIFEDGNPDGNLSINNLNIAPFGSFYLKKGGKEIAGPAIVRVADDVIYISFENFEVPITEDIEGDSYSLTGTFLPFISDDSSIILSVDFTKESGFLAKNLSDNNKLIPTTKRMEFNKMIIDNNFIECVESEDFKGSCAKFLSQKDISNEKVRSKIAKTTIDQYDEPINKKEEKTKDIVEDKKADVSEKTKKIEIIGDLVILPKELQIDSDNDGLFDIEEKFIKSDAKVTDSDNDGLDDFYEVENASSPITKGQKLLFSDLAEADWCKKYVSRLKLFGVIKDNDKFYPNNAITRGDFVQLAVDAFREEVLPSVAMNPFVDIPKNHEYAGQILYAKKKGAIKGYENKTFRADTNLTRAEAVKILLALKNITTTSKKSNFKDLDTWQTPWVQKAFELGVVKGFSESEFKPNDNVTRAQSAKMIVNLIWL